jgi:hypothetical protein
MSESWTSSSGSYNNESHFLSGFFHFGGNFRAVPFLFHYRETSNEICLCLIECNSVAVVLIISVVRMMVYIGFVGLIRSFALLIHY